jgi:hypothetical protein
LLDWHDWGLIRLDMELKLAGLEEVPLAIRIHAFMHRCIHIFSSSDSSESYGHSLKIKVVRSWRRGLAKSLHTHYDIQLAKIFPKTGLIQNMIPSSRCFFFLIICTRLDVGRAARAV